MTSAPTRIFISYSHDSKQHQDAVLSLANRLRHDGLDCMIDQYVNGFPAENWPRWMEAQIEQADFVLVVCTPVYLKRYRGLDNDGGRGVTFEGVVISQTLYDAYNRNTKFVPVLPDTGDHSDVPLPLKGFSAFRMSENYGGLYRYLTDQAKVVAPKLGEPVILQTDTGLNRISLPNGKQTQPINNLNTVYPIQGKEFELTPMWKRWFVKYKKLSVGAALGLVFSGFLLLGEVSGAFLNLEQIWKRWSAAPDLELSYTPEGRVYADSRINLRYQAPPNGFISLWNQESPDSAVVRLIPDPKTEISTTQALSDAFFYETVQIRPTHSNGIERYILLWTPKSYPEHLPQYRYLNLEVFEQILQSLEDKKHLVSTALEIPVFDSQ